MIFVISIHRPDTEEPGGEEATKSGGEIYRKKTGENKKKNGCNRYSNKFDG